MEEKQLELNNFNNCALYLIMALLGVVLIVFGVVMAIIGKNNDFDLFSLLCP